MKPIIEVKNLSKVYRISHARKPYHTLREDLIEVAKTPIRFLRGHQSDKEEFWALKDISFNVKKGEVLGIIGRNGAGKSTLLKILSRITDPTNGSAVLRGRVASLLEVGTGFHPELTGRENIYLNGALLGMSRQEISRKFDEIVSFSEIEKFLDTPVKFYSSGMHVRLAFAVAAHLEPEILIVDEVLAVGDAAFQKKSLGKMGEVSKSGRTILFVSHNMNAIRQLCTSAIVLEEGRVVFSGSPSQSITYYTQEFQKNIFEREFIKNQTHNTSAAVLKVSIKTNRTTKEIRTDQDIVFSIDYDRAAGASTVGFTLVLKDQDENVVFSSINNRERDWYGKEKPPGLYRTSCTIPANLLNDGWYSISLIMFGRNFSDVVQVGELLTFEVQDNPALRGDFLGKFGGVIRPDLTWRTEQL